MNIRFMALAAILTTSVSFAMMHDSGSPSSSQLPTVAHPMVRLSKEYMTPAHAAAYIPWEKGANWQLEAGECGMIVQTSVDYPKDNDVFRLLSVPQRIVNSVPAELNSNRWPMSGGDSMRCTSMLASMIVEINRILVVQGSEVPGTLAHYNQRVLALAIALAYNGKTYRAQAKWDEKADQLVPFISVDHIHEDTASVALRVDSITGTPIAERALSGL